MRRRPIAAAFGLFVLSGGVAFAGGHTWRVAEVFSDASGNIQFVELVESGGGAGETATAGHDVTSNTKAFRLTANAVAPTSNKRILLGTPGYKALPGAPPPDYDIPAGSVPFFSTALAEVIRYIPYDTWNIPAGSIPTDGVNSLHRTGVALNSPTNYAGTTGSINANPPAAPPGVPDGASAGSIPMTVTPLDVAGVNLQISWDTASCTGDTGFHIVFGQKTDLPTAVAGTFSLDGGVCGMGATSPFTWNQVPDATDGHGLIWWLILANDGGTTEGSWGHGSAPGERQGPGADGASLVCGVATKSLTNTCGH